MTDPLAYFLFTFVLAFSGSLCALWVEGQWCTCIWRCPMYIPDETCKEERANAGHI